MRGINDAHTDYVADGIACRADRLHAQIFEFDLFSGTVTVLAHDRESARAAIPAALGSIDFDQLDATLSAFEDAVFTSRFPSSRS